MKNIFLENCLLKAKLKNSNEETMNRCKGWIRYFYTLSKDVIDFELESWEYDMTNETIKMYCHFYKDYGGYWDTIAVPVEEVLNPNFDSKNG